MSSDLNPNVHGETIIRIDQILIKNERCHSAIKTEAPIGKLNFRSYSNTQKIAVKMAHGLMAERV
jgi:hypothetical protein